MVQNDLQCIIDKKLTQLVKTVSLNTLIDIYEEKKIRRGQKILIKNNLKFAGKFIYEIEMNEKCFVHGHIWSDEFVDQKNGKIARNSKILSSLS